MKDILRLPILFIFVFVLIFLLFFALSVLALWGGVSSEGPEAALRTLETAIPAILLRVLPPALLVSLIILLARISAKPGSRLLSLIVPLAGTFFLLALGYQLIVAFDSTAGTESVTDPSPSRYLVPGVFNISESKVVYIEDLDESIASPVILMEEGRADKKLLYFPQGRVDVKEDTVSLKMAGYTLEVDTDPALGGMFAEGPSLQRFFADIDFLNRELERTYRHSLPAFYFAVLALVLAFYGSGMLLRLTRWYLLNLALNLLMLRGFLALFRFLREGVVLELEKNLSNPQALQFLPELALLVLGGLLLILDLLFVPFHRREEG